MARRIPGEELSVLQARRIALAHLGLHQAPARGPVGRAQIRKMTRRLGVLQIDSVNILQRAHYMPLFSRLGPYDIADLEREAYGGRRRSLFEYWGHEASLLPVDLQPCFRWRMQDAAQGQGIYARLARFAAKNGAAIDAVRAEIAERGPLAASEITGASTAASEPWWGWSVAKEAAEYLFWAGEITTATRRTAGFTRIYDLSERVLPQAIVDTPTPSREDAQRTLLGQAIQSLGVGTEADLRDYYRLPAVESKARVQEMVEEGTLIPAIVKGWKDPAYLAPDARNAGKRGLKGCTLLSPFDPVCWFRPRAERLFGFHYRIEIYTPAPKRQFGYYVLPIVMDDRLVGRLDMKADRAGRRLQILGAFTEAQENPDQVAHALCESLDQMAHWLSLDSVHVTNRGDLAKPLGACLRG